MGDGTSTHRLYSLDGLRAISIILVLMGHVNGTRGFGRIQALLVFGDISHLGVVVFFIISGFLITTLLAREHSQLGRVSLKLFYARRALRILPASFAYLGVLLGLASVGLVVLRPTDVAHALTCTVNYATDRSWYVGHLWSLSVEEQFYLLWPFAFVIAGRRKALWIATSVTLMGPLARLAAGVLLSRPYRDLEMFPLVADSVAIGCVLALSRDWLESQGWYVRLFKPWSSLALLAIVLLLNRYMAYTVVRVLGTCVVNINLAILIHRAVYCWRDSLGRMLNWVPLAFCGTLSYSLYLWQQLFLDRRSEAWQASFPQNLGLAILAALFSYFLLEMPLMKMRRRPQPV